MERGIYIGAGITAASGVVAYALLPITGMTNLPLHFGVVRLWLTVTVIVVACHLFWDTIALAMRGRERPLAVLWSRIERKQAIVVCVGTLLLATNLAFFGTIKPQLGQLVAFSADPLFADIDLFLFGSDPWRLVQWFDHFGMAVIYHKGWFLWLAFILYYLLKQPASAEKDRLLISYVALWSIFGPLVHLAFPAAGPVFYDELGYGNRFADLDQSAELQVVAAYLWNGYSAKTFNFAGGISAMPSLHLATMFWTIIVLRNTRLAAVAWAFTIYIFIGSVAIGWHYAIDGLVGGIGALVCYALAGIEFDRRASFLPRLRRKLSAAVVAADVHQTQNPMR